MKKMALYLTLLLVCPALTQAEMKTLTTARGTTRDAEPEEMDIPPVLKEFFGTKLIDAKKAKHSPAELSGKKIGIYFSAHWCPPCRRFTPILVESYNQMKKEGKDFEIVFVSSDRDSAAMIGYMKEMNMPWLALPHGSTYRDHLAQKFGVRGIPTLIIINDQGKTLSTNGRGDITSKGAAAFDSW